MRSEMALKVWARASRPIGRGAFAVLGAVWFTLTLSTSAALAAEAPVNVEAPAISGPEFVGQVLSTDAGDWEGADSFLYRWKRCSDAGSCSVIPDAQSETYTPVSADHGWQLAADVIAVNASGQTVATTEATGTIFNAPYVAADGSECGIHFLCPSSDGAAPADLTGLEIECREPILCMAIDALPGISLDDLDACLRGSSECTITQLLPGVSDPNDCVGTADICTVRRVADALLTTEDPNDCQGTVDACRIVAVITEAADDCFDLAVNCPAGVPILTCGVDAQVCGAVEVLQLILTSCAQAVGSRTAADGGCADVGLVTEIGSLTQLTSALTEGDARAAAEDVAPDGVTLLGAPAVSGTPTVQQTNLHFVIGGPNAVLSYYETKVGAPRYMLGDDPSAEASRSGGACNAATPSGAKADDFERDYPIVDETEETKSGKRTFIFQTFWYRKYGKLRRNDGSTLNTGLMAACTRGRAYPAEHRGLRHTFAAFTVIPNNGARNTDSVQPHVSYDWVTGSSSGIDNSVSVSIGGSFGPVSVSASQGATPRTNEYWSGDFNRRPPGRFRAPAVFDDFSRYNFYAYWSATGKNIDVNSGRGTALGAGWQFIHREGRPTFEHYSHYHTCTYSSYNGCPREQYNGNET